MLPATSLEVLGYSAQEIKEWFAIAILRETEGEKTKKETDHYYHRVLMLVVRLLG